MRSESTKRISLEAKLPEETFLTHGNSESDFGLAMSHPFGTLCVLSADLSTMEGSSAHRVTPFLRGDGARRRRENQHSHLL